MMDASVRMERTGGPRSFVYVSHMGTAVGATGATGATSATGAVGANRKKALLEARPIVAPAVNVQDIVKSLNDNDPFRTILPALSVTAAQNEAAALMAEQRGSNALRNRTARRVATETRNAERRAATETRNAERRQERYAEEIMRSHAAASDRRAESARQNAIQRNAAAAAASQQAASQAASAEIDQLQQDARRYGVVQSGDT